MLKLYLDYGGSPTIDLSDKILSISSLSRRVESQKPGEPGVISLDNVSLELPLSAFPNDEMSFANLDSNPDYIFTIKIDFGGTEYKVFEGILDKSSVEHTKAETAKFDVLDKINALKLIENDPPRVLASWDAGGGYSYEIKSIGGSDPNEFGIFKRNDNNGTYVDQNNVLPEGGILHIDSAQEFFIINSYSEFDSYVNAYFNRVETYSERPADQVVGQILQYYPQYFYGEIIHEVTDGKVSNFDAIAIIKSIIRQQWPGVSVINRTGYTTYNISLDWWDQLVTTCFNKHPLEALKFLAYTMRIYLYVNTAGAFVLEKFDQIGQFGSLDIDSNYQLLDYSKKYDWQKTVQYVKITNANDSNDYAEYPTDLKIIPTAKLERDVFKFSNNLDTIAQEYYQFYGQKRLAASLRIPLDQDNVSIDITDKVLLWSDEWFVISINIDVINMILDLDIVEL